jgi:hypothetical protein
MLLLHAAHLFLRHDPCFSSAWPTSSSAMVGLFVNLSLADLLLAPGIRDPAVGQRAGKWRFRAPTMTGCDTLALETSARRTSSLAARHGQPRARVNDEARQRRRSGGFRARARERGWSSAGLVPADEGALRLLLFQRNLEATAKSSWC